MTIADAGGPTQSGGGSFTRFMLAGFGTYRALERVGVPRLRVLSRPAVAPLVSIATSLPPKSSTPKALAVRRDIVASLAAGLGLRARPCRKMLTRLTPRCWRSRPPPRRSANIVGGSPSMRGTFHARARRSPGALPRHRRRLTSVDSTRVTSCLADPGARRYTRCHHSANSRRSFSISTEPWSISTARSIPPCAARSTILGQAPPLTPEHYHQALAHDDLCLGVPENEARRLHQAGVRLFPRRNRPHRAA